MALIQSAHNKIYNCQIEIKQFESEHFPIKFDTASICLLSCLFLTIARLSVSRVSSCAITRI